jgi:serine/threonine protein kinase
MSEREIQILPPDTQINQWTVSCHIGHGGYGEIYSVTKSDSDISFAMKTEFKNARKHGILEEIEFISNLQGTHFFPQFIESGETADMRYFVMELLGPTVSVVRRALPGQRYKRLTALVLAKEMLECIEALHERGIVHRDIKPGNFLFRRDRKHIICLIDFGLSKQFVHPETGDVLPPRRAPGFIGTCSFASLNAHDGMELGRRDDVISWIYTIIEITEKKLPWPGSKDREATVEAKTRGTPDVLCKSLGPQFMAIFDNALQLDFADKPDYEMYYRLLNEAIAEAGPPDEPYDWENGFESCLRELPKRVAGGEEEASEEESSAGSEHPEDESEVPEEARPEAAAPLERPGVVAEEVAVEEAAVDEPKKVRSQTEKKKKKKVGEEDEPVCHACAVA